MPRAIHPLFPSLVLLLLPALAAAGEFDTRVPLERAASGNFYVEGVLNASVHSRFLVDTGSGLVTISAALLDASVTAQAYSDARARSIENIHDVEKVVSALPTGVLIASDALEVRSANRAALALVSVSRAMLLGNQLSAVLPYGRVVAAHATRLLRGDLAEPELVVEDTTSDGAPRTLRLTLARIEGGVLITLDDISKVRALQESASAMKRRPLRRPSTRIGPLNDAPTMRSAFSGLKLKPSAT